MTVWVIEEVAYYRTVQFPFNSIQDPNTAEEEYTAKGVFSELNRSGRKRGESLAEGVKTQSGFDMCPTSKMLIV